jgi:hypothetical protein
MNFTAIANGLRIYIRWPLLSQGFHEGFKFSWEGMTRASELFEAARKKIPSGGVRWQAFHIHIGGRRDTGGQTIPVNGGERALNSPKKQLNWLQMSRVVTKRSAILPCPRKTMNKRSPIEKRRLNLPPMISRTFGDLLPFYTKRVNPNEPSIF